MLQIPTLLQPKRLRLMEIQGLLRGQGRGREDGVEGKGAELCISVRPLPQCRDWRDGEVLLPQDLRRMQGSAAS